MDYFFRVAGQNIRLSGPALGRPKKDEQRDKIRDYRDECERIEVERRFSLAKRKCGMGIIVTKLEETIAYCVAMSVIVLNLRKVQYALLRLLLNWAMNYRSGLKIAFIQ